VTAEEGGTYDVFRIIFFFANKQKGEGCEPVALLPSPHCTPFMCLSVRADFHVFSADAFLTASLVL
jgi:hypothetical protein